MTRTTGPKYLSEENIIQSDHLDPFALERVEEECRAAGMDVYFKQLYPGPLHTTTWTITSPICIVQYLATNIGVEAKGSFPKEFAVLSLSLDNSALSQNGLLATGNKWILLAPHQENYAHDVRPDGGDTLLLYFPASLFESFKDYFEKGGKFSSSSAINLNPTKIQHWKMIEMAMQARAVGNSHAIEPVFNDITELFLNVLYSRITTTNNYSKTQFNKLKIFLFLQDYIDCNYNQSLNMKDLSIKAHTTQRTMDRIFKEQVDMSPIKYLITCRLNNTRKKIIDPDYHDLTISQIARDAGFSHLGRFSSYFKQHFGFTPTELRKMSNSSSVR